MFWEPKWTFWNDLESQASYFTPATIEKAPGVGVENSNLRWGLKPWLNGLASGRKFSTSVLKLCSVWRHTCVDLLWPALTFVSFSPFGHPTKVDTQYIREIHDFLWLAWTWEPTCESVWPPIASPYASAGFANLPRLASSLNSSNSKGIK